MARRNYASMEDALENGEGVERPFICPDHDDTKPSASLNVEKMVWCCYVCGAKGRTDRKGGASALTSEMKSFILALEGETAIPLHGKGWLDMFDGWAPHPYWVKRFGLEAARRWRLGVHPTTGLPTYPVFTPNGAVAGVVQRNWGTPKYIYPRDVPMSRFLFGYKARKVGLVVVVEGACDAIAVSEALGPIGHVMVVAAYGAGLHRPQVEMISKLEPVSVLLGFDDDSAGERAKSRDYGFQCAVRPISWGAKDPGEIEKHEVVRAIGEVGNSVRKAG